MNAVTSLAPGQRLLGLFHDSNMTTEYNPLIASDTGAGSATTKCTPANIVDERRERVHLLEAEGERLAGIAGNTFRGLGAKAPLLSLRET